MQFLSQNGLSFDIVFFSFTKDTNAGQSYRLTHCITNLHRYNLTSLAFKHSLLLIYAFKNTTQKDFFLVSQSLANPISLPFSLFHLVQTRIREFKI